jgi:hypothetical protein
VVAADSLLAAVITGTVIATGKETVNGIVIEMRVLDHLHIAAEKMTG